MANALKVIDKLAAVAAEIFTEVSYVAQNSVRSLEDEFSGSAKIGNSVRVKIPSRYAVNDDTFSDGKTSYSRGTRNAIAQEVRTLVCDKSKWIGMDLTSEELAVFAGEDAKAMKELLQQPIANLARQTDLSSFGQMALSGLGRVVMLDATKGFTTDDASRMNAVLAEQLSASSDRKLALGALDMSKAQISAKGLFQSATDIAEQYKKGIVSTGQGFDSWFDTQSLPTITIGTAFSLNGNKVHVGANYVSGATSLVLHGEDSTVNGKTIKAYQAIEIEAVYGIDPQTLTAIPRKATVINQADVTFGTDGIATLTVVPMYTTTGNITLGNVSSLPIANAKVTIVENTTGANSGLLAKVAIAWQKKGVAFATIPLPKDLPGAECSVMSQDGIDLRIIRQYDKTANAVTTIADIQYGTLITRPEWIGSCVGFMQ
jgi:hypothetical protein